MKLLIKKSPKLGKFAHQIEPARCKHKATVEEAMTWEPDEIHVYEPKWDGVRFLLQVRPNHASRNFLTTRHISKKTGRYCEEHRLTKITQHRFEEFLTDTVFDGELIGDGISTDVQHFRTTGEVKFAVFDLLRFCGQDMTDLPYEERRERLEKLAKYFPEWMKLTESHQNAPKLLKAVLNANGEGIVRKRVDAPYRRGWTKIKKQDTEDVVVHGYLETKSADYKARGWIGALRIGQYLVCETKAELDRVKLTFGARFLGAKHKASKIFALIDCGRCDGFTKEMRDRISKNQESFLGSVIEIKFGERLKSGYFRSPKFVRVRDDKPAEQCSYNVK